MSYYSEVRELAKLPRELCSAFPPHGGSNAGSRKGTAVHKWIDAYLTGQKPAALELGFGGMECLAFMKWLKVGRDIRQMEMMGVYEDSGEAWFAGQMDNLGVDPGAVFSVRDYKTGRFYRSSELQLGGYSLMVKQMQMGYPKRAELIYLGVDAEFHLHTLDEATLLEREAQFLELLIAAKTLGKI